MLRPRQEKVIRLYFGLGCQRPHSVLEIAEAFAVSSQVIAGILGAAESRLARCECTHSMAVLADVFNTRWAALSAQLAETHLDLTHGADIPLKTLGRMRSEEHTSELQSLRHLVCR